MSRTMHVSLCIKSFLERHKAKKYYTKLFQNSNGKALTPEEAKDYLYEELLKGRRIIPFGKCDNFDYQNGCLGHENDK